MGTLYSFLCAATACDVLGTDNAGELDSHGFQYPFCQYPLSILWQVFLVVSDTALLSYLLEKVVNINIYNFSKVRARLPGVCLSKAMI